MNGGGGIVENVSLVSPLFRLASRLQTPLVTHIRCRVMLNTSQPSHSSF